MGIGEMGDDVCEKEASSPMDRAMKIAEGNVVEINTAFAQKGIEIPYPVQTVLMKK